MNLTPHTFVASDGVRIAWYELGEGSNEPPIILQHGFTAHTRHEWIDSGIAARLSPLGRRMIGVDARGHGASDKPHDSQFYGETRMAEDIIELVVSLGIPAYDFVGYSMGGAIGTVVAMLDPKLRRVVISGVGEAMVLTGGVDTRVFDPADLAEALLTSEPERLTGLPAAFRAGAELRHNDLAALAAQCRTIRPRQLAFDRIGAIALIMAGTDDPLAANPGRLADAINGASLQLVPGDHSGARLTPEFSAALLHFLA
jgi:pimeloyl-ACP methyl ester carboxylesterase